MQQKSRVQKGEKHNSNVLRKTKARQTDGPRCENEIVYSDVAQENFANTK